MKHSSYKKKKESDIEKREKKEKRDMRKEEREKKAPYYHGK